MRIIAGFYRSYKTHSYCSRCGEKGWYNKESGLTRCPIHGTLLRVKARYNSAKRRDKKI